MGALLPSSTVTAETLAVAAARSAVIAAAAEVRDAGSGADLSDVIAALGVLAGGVDEPVHLLGWELARTVAALDAIEDGYGVGERPLADDAVQVWVAAAADAMVERLATLLEGRDAGGFLVEAFSQIDAAFGEPEALPSWRTELRDAFCDPDAVPDGSVLLGEDQAGLWEMLLCVEYARVGSFDVVAAALEKAGPDSTLGELGPYLVSWFAVPHLAGLVADAAGAELTGACVDAFTFFDATIEALTD